MQNDEPNLGPCPICSEETVVLMRDPRGRIVAICDGCESFWTSWAEFQTLLKPPIAPPEPLSKITIGDAEGTEWRDGVADPRSLAPEEDSIL